MLCLAALQAGGHGALGAAAILHYLLTPCLIALLLLTACRQVDMAPWELLLSVRIPFTGPTEFAKEFKQAPRRDDDIAIVNAGEKHFQLI
jgi:xanthine dehydrogenase iron-sulfur cluster and FAD-binding subunit A